MHVWVLFSTLNTICSRDPQFNFGTCLRVVFLLLLLRSGDEVLLLPSETRRVSAAAASQIHSGKLKARFVSCCRQVGENWEDGGRRATKEVREERGKGGTMQQEWIARRAQFRGNKLCLIIRGERRGATFKCRWQHLCLKEFQLPILSAYLLFKLYFAESSPVKSCRLDGE